MSCHDWTRALAHRLDPAAGRPSDWEALEEHLEACSACRTEATAIDPTLAFRGAGVWVPPVEETAAIRQAVRTLRRTGAIESPLERRRPTRDRGPLAAAALIAVILALQPAGTALNTVEETERAMERLAPRLLRVAGPSAPAIEGTDRPDARVYEWGADDLSVVMVVDESLDV